MIKVDYAALVVHVKSGCELDYFAALDQRSYDYEGLVKAKERPRMTRGGRVFTPEETRRFESSVKQWAKKLEAPVVKYPIRVALTIYEPPPKTDTGPYGNLIYNQRGDVDNLAKAILDGLNGVLYADDKQISDLHIRRMYGEPCGFQLVIARAGLTALEHSNYRKRLK